MRRMLVVMLLLVTFSMFAADRGTVRVSGFEVNGNQAINLETNGDAYAGAIDYWWLPRVSSALTISDEPVKTTRFRLATIGGIPGSIPYTATIHLRPIDASLRYHFATGSRLDPYVGGGVRYL